DQSHPDQGSDGDGRHAGARVPPADVPDERRQSREAPRDPQALRPDQVAPMSVAGGETSPNVGRRGASTADIVVAGAAGRMGNRIVACLAGQPDLRLVAALEAPGHAAIGRDAGELAGIGKAGVSVSTDAAAEITRDRVLIEFSVPEASLAHLRLVAHSGARAVIGTTGFTAAQRTEIGELAKRAAIVLSPNMSVA